MVKRHSKKSQERQKTEKDEKRLLKSHFAVAGHVFIQRPRLIALAADRMAYKGYCKRLPYRTRPYQIISVGYEYIKIDQYGIENAVSINQMTRVTKEGSLRQSSSQTCKPITKITPVRCQSSTTSLASTLSKILSVTRTDLQIHAIFFDGAAIDLRTRQSNPLLNFFSIFGMHTIE